jgi:hypothetical protein
MARGYLSSPLTTHLSFGSVGTEKYRDSNSMRM